MAMGIFIGDAPFNSGISIGLYPHNLLINPIAQVIPTSTHKRLNKINRNIFNDAKATKALQQAGWNVLEEWGYTLKDAILDNTMNAIQGKIW